MDGGDRTGFGMGLLVLLAQFVSSALVVSSYLMPVPRVVALADALSRISLGNFPLCAFGAAFCTLSTSRALENLCSRLGRDDVRW